MPIGGGGGTQNDDAFDKTVTFDEELDKIVVFKLFDCGTTICADAFSEVFVWSSRLGIVVVGGGGGGGGGGTDGGAVDGLFTLLSKSTMFSVCVNLSTKTFRTLLSQSF